MRLTRAQQQERTRGAVLAAAHQEFSEHGYRDATVDRIAERASLTRGAVYSNFPGKRALYLAVLLDVVERENAGEAPEAPPHLQDALESFARAWLDRLPLYGDTPADAVLRLRSIDGMFDSADGRTALAGITRLETFLLARALEACPPAAPGGRRVRLAEVIRTVLDGAGHLAASAPGVGDPFDVVRACEHLADLPLTDVWDPPHLPFVKPAEPVDQPWDVPGNLPDLLTGSAVDLNTDGILVAAGAGRLSAAEEAVRSVAARSNDGTRPDPRDTNRADPRDDGKAGPRDAERAERRDDGPSGSHGDGAADSRDADRAGPRDDGPSGPHGDGAAGPRDADRAGPQADGPSGPHGDGAASSRDADKADPRSGGGAGRLSGSGSGAGRLSGSGGGDVVRAASGRITIVVVADHDTAALARMRIRDLAVCLRRAVGNAFRPGFALVLDDGTVGAALGVAAETDTETAVRITDGRIVLRATGHGAAHAIGAHR